MTTISRASQLKLSLILSRMRREIMRGSTAAASSSSSSSSDKHTANSTPSISALKSHYSLLDERRRGSASARLVGRVDPGGDDRITNAKLGNARDRPRIRDTPERPAPDQTRLFEEIALEYGLADGSESLYAGDSMPEMDRALRRDVPDLAGALESVFDQVEKNTNPIYKKRSWTTDDIILREDDETIGRKRLTLDTILGDEGVKYYQLLDKYFAHNVQQQDAPFHCDGKREAVSMDVIGEMTLVSPMDQAAVANFAATTQPERNPANGPSKDQLIDVYNSLRQELPRLLDKNLDYSMFSDKVVFINNWHGNATTSVGLKSLICRMSLLRAICNILFVRSEMQLLKIMVFEEESCVRVRWRIEGTGILVKAASSQRFDGVATFRVDNHGKIARVEVERVLPDEEHVKKKKSPMSLALAALIGGAGILTPNAESVAAPATLLSTSDGGPDPEV